MSRLQEAMREDMMPPEPEEVGWHVTVRDYLRDRKPEDLLEEFLWALLIFGALCLLIFLWRYRRMRKALLEPNNNTSVANKRVLQQQTTATTGGGKKK